MRKKLLLPVLAIVVGSLGCIGRELTFTLAEKGSLDSLLRAEDRSQITALTVTGVFGAEDAKALSSLPNLSELVLPGVAQAISPSGLKLDKLRSIRYTGDIEYISGQTYVECPALETVIYDGGVGHTDGYCYFRCPELRKVVFNGPVISTGGALLMGDCPKVETVELNGLVVGCGLGENSNCPSFKGYKVNGIVLQSGYPDWVPQSTEQQIKKSGSRMKKWLREVCSVEGKMLDSEMTFLQRMGYQRRQSIVDLCEAYGVGSLTAEWPEKPAERVRESMLSKLELLRESKPYRRSIEFGYAQADDSMLTVTRERFNLDSVAGDGDELSKIKNLLHFVHEAVRHDGNSPWPEVAFNFGDLYDVCKREDRGVNCRFMAIMLAEVLMSEGIPARYISCVPKNYDEDRDSHVITVAWSRQLGKWIWVDPTWDAMVMDENGLYLHPGEVRERLISGKPLVLSDGANWNHSSTTDAEQYLYNYMAKNLYFIGCNTINQSEPEGAKLTRPHELGSYVWLVPEGSDFGNQQIHDDSVFWAAPY